MSLSTEITDLAQSISEEKADYDTDKHGFEREYINVFQKLYSAIKGLDQRGRLFKVDFLTKKMGSRDSANAYGMFMDWLEVHHRGDVMKFKNPKSSYSSHPKEWKDNWNKSTAELITGVADVKAMMGPTGLALKIKSTDRDWYALLKRA